MLKSVLMFAIVTQSIAALNQVAVAQSCTVDETANRDQRQPRGTCSQRGLSEAQCQAIPGSRHFKPDHGLGFTECFFNPSTNSGDTNQSVRQQIDREYWWKLGNESFDAATRDYEAGNYSSAFMKYDHAEYRYRQNNYLDSMNAAAEGKRLSWCLALIRQASRSEELLPLKGEGSRPRGGLGPPPVMASPIDEYGICSEFPDALVLLNNRLDQPNSKAPPATSTSYDPGYPFNQYKPSGYKFAECGSTGLPGSLFDSGPIKYSCRHTELSHLQKPGKDEPRMFIGLACARGNTQEVARHNAASTAKELVFHMQIAKAGELGADSTRNEIFITDKVDLHCVLTN